MAGSTENDRSKNLEKERQKILADLEKLRDALRTEVDPDADEGDPDLVEHEKTLALVQNLERKLQSVEYALRQSQTGTYGICERCGETIPPERLEAVPEATLCVRCKGIVERRQGSNSVPSRSNAF